MAWKLGKLCKRGKVTEYCNHKATYDRHPNKIINLQFRIYLIFIYTKLVQPPSLHSRTIKSFEINQEKIK